MGCADDEGYQPDGKDIAFYGKVIDQYNNPVPDYAFECSLDTYLTAPNVRMPGKVRLNVTTDAHGEFLIQNKGYQLII